MPKPISCPRRLQVAVKTSRASRNSSAMSTCSAGFSTGTGSLKYHHHAVTSIAFERAVVLDDDFADSRVVVAQQGHHVFRVGAFGETGETAQVAEERGNLSAMAFKLLLAPRRND